MKSYNAKFIILSKSESATPTVLLPTGLRNHINLLVLIHFLFFAWYLLYGLNGLSGQYLADGTLNYFVNYDVTAAYNLQEFKWQSFTSIFTYQFVHLSVGESLLSMSMLWLFGNLLRLKIGSLKTVLLYFSFVALSAIVYNVSHWVFPIFSGPKGLLDGAFSGVLGIMTTTVFFYGKYQLHIHENITVALWKVYVAAILISLIFVYEHNIAYIIVYVSGIYLGIKSGEFIQKSNQRFI